MANSRFSYVRNFELKDNLLPSTFLLIRLDGKNFHNFSVINKFEKPNDINALNLMNQSAKRVLNGKELNQECVLAFGESDEFSFLFKKSCNLHGRRASKLTTLVTSLFTSAYIFLWPQYFPNTPLTLEDLPIFDGRIVQYPNELEVKDYFRWRQADTHINNMYNTCFWSLVHDGLTTQEANKELNGTISSQKQELLFSRFGINYNNLAPMFRKGSILMWEDEAPIESPPAVEEAEADIAEEVEAEAEAESQEVGKTTFPKRKIKIPKIKRQVIIVYEDLMNDSWWETGRGKDLLKD